jgi:NDP-sugar pyrophosphorylase family protein
VSARVVVLAGGPGSRLLHHRTVVPKALLPVGDRSVLEVMLGQLAAHGFSEITLAVGELVGLIRALLGDGERQGVRLRYVKEHEPHGTAGVLGALDLDEPFLLMNGNVLSTLDYRALWDAHRASGNTVTIATHRREVVADYGVLRLGGDGTDSVVLDYVEKPASTFDVSMGIYAMQPEVRRYIADGEVLGLPELVNRLLADGLRVGAFPHQGLWLDMRRREDFELAQAGIEEIVPLLPRAWHIYAITDSLGSRATVVVPSVAASLDG